MHRKPLLLATGALLLAAACGGTSTTTPPPTTGAAPTIAPTIPATATPTLAPTAAPTAAATAAPTPAAETPSATAAGEATVQLADSDLGEILVDAEGLTLYGFVPDAESGESTCYDGCETAWPPLTVEGGDFTVGTGLDESVFTTVERTDGTMQLKVGDYPLYYFSGDAAPGETNGQGLNEVWYVVGADGELIQE